MYKGSHENLLSTLIPVLCVSNRLRKDMECYNLHRFEVHVDGGKNKNHPSCHWVWKHLSNLFCGTHVICPCCYTTLEVFGVVYGGEGSEAQRQKISRRNEILFRILATKMWASILMIVSKVFYGCSIKTSEESNDRWDFVNQDNFWGGKIPQAVGLFSNSEWQLGVFCNFPFLHLRNYLLSFTGKTGGNLNLNFNSTGGFGVLIA